MHLYDDVEVQVHGGLTFGCRVKDGRWFGFDTAHAFDHAPGLDFSNNIYGIPLPQGLDADRKHAWTLIEVKAEVENLAEQLAKRGAFP